ncbi:MAG: M13 family metallopeptidase [Verrucomicrobiota bacterium]
MSTSTSIFRASPLSWLAAVCLAAAGHVILNTPAAESAATTGVDLAGMDRSVPPGDSFDGFANGTWLKTTEIPPDKASYGTGAIVQDRTRENLTKLIEEAAQTNSTRTAAARQVGDFYAAYMDEATIERRGIAPVKEELARIAGVADRQGLARQIGGTLRADVDALNNTEFYTGNLFGVWVTQGLYDPKHHYPYLLQGGLGMPDREYYVSPSPKMAELRTRYQAHVEAMLRLAGYADPRAAALRIIALELKIAEGHATRAESADSKRAAVWARAEFEQKAPGLDWTALFQAAGLNQAPTFYVWHPGAVTALAKLTTSESLQAWKDWLAFHAIEHAAPYLAKAFDEENFAFHGKALTGTPEMRPRAKRGVDFTSAALGGRVGRLYVERYFPPEAKAKVEAMVRDLEAAFSKRIDQLSWMSAATKAKAHEKLRTLHVGVGYPDQWPDDVHGQIERDDAWGNARRAELFHYQHALAKLSKAPDTQEWWMDPQIVNALNLPLQNALNFPAAILQPPFFDSAADAAHNYGAIGAVIGHEISHSFDDQGSLFDAAGRLSNWWTDADLAHFTAAGDALVRQYDQYRPFPDLAVSGRQTLSENLADLAGLAAAFDAFRLALEGNPLPTVEGFTPEQRFFISFAQCWRRKTREPALRKQIATDGHAPAQYRSATVRNLNPWYEAFAVKAGQTLYLDPPERVRVW